MTDWTLTYDGFDPAEEGLREALTSTGNGYFCSRGAAEWEDAGGVHYPGTYVHGGYNRETTIMGGLPVLNEDLVNMPDWLVLKLRIEGEEVIRLADIELLSYRHEYDVHNAIVSRMLRFRDGAGRETALLSRRFVSMAHAHQAGIEWTLTPENWSGRVEIISAIDGRVTNRGVARYREFEGRHLVAVTTRTFGPEVIALMVRTRQSRIHVALAARARVLSRRPAGRCGAGSTRWRTTSSRRSPSTWRRAGRCASRSWSPSSPHETRDQRAAWQRRQVRARLPLVRRGAGAPPAAWDELWEACDLVCRATSACSSCCAFTSRTSCRSARRTQPSTMRVSSRAG